MSEDEGMSAEREAQLRGYQSLTGCNGEELFLEIDRLRAATAAMKGKLRSFELWMDAASKSGFVFATKRDGFEITHNPPLCREILAIRVEDAEQQIAALTKELDEARAIPGLPVGMRIKRMWISSVDSCVGGVELAPLEDEAPPEPPKIVCVLCGFPAKYCEDEKLWRHVPSNGIICDKYGYPIDVKPEPNAKGTCVCEIGKRFNSACPQHGGHPEAIEQALEPGAKGVSAEADLGSADKIREFCAAMGWTPQQFADPMNNDALVAAALAEMNESAQAETKPEPQFTDRERLDWLASNTEFDVWWSNQGKRVTFSRDDKHGGPGGGEYFEGSTLREAIDAAMLSSGLKPQQRESVTMGELHRAFYDAVDMEVACDATDKIGIRAVLAAVRASDGTMKDVED